MLPCIESDSGDLDGIPVVLMEAMSLGVPVLSTRVSGIPELLTNAGFLSESSDPKLLADQLAKMINLTPLQVSEISGKAKDRIRREFLRTKEVEKLLKLFAE